MFAYPPLYLKSAKLLIAFTHPQQTTAYSNKLNTVNTVSFVSVVDEIQI
ncbi:MAG: hypothetical protein QS721_04085 [Candidatus Endonucleobacter sp. (ex Gigantidas childressi)]|nr:hypothetical protein [Candidatus Endonucleobacter sp. (ex Gigantidas childressi)]